MQTIMFGYISECSWYSRGSLIFLLLLTISTMCSRIQKEEIPNHFLYLPMATLLVMVGYSVGFMVISVKVKLLRKELCH